VDKKLEKLRARIRSFVETEIEETDAIPASLEEKIREMGLFGVAGLEQYGSDHLKDKYFPMIASGEARAPRGASFPKTGAPSDRIARGCATRFLPGALAPYMRLSAVIRSCVSGCVENRLLSRLACSRSGLIM